VTEWPTLKLKHLAQVRASNVDKKSNQGEMPVRLCNYTDVYRNDLITNDLSFMSATATAEQVARFTLKAGDTVLTKDSETADDIGVPAFLPGEIDRLVCGYHLSLVRPTKAVEPKFLFWALNSQSVRSYFTSRAKGITRFGLDYDDILNAPVATPSLGIQRAVARLLDDKTPKVDELIRKKNSEIVAVEKLTDSVVAHELEAWVGDAARVPLLRVVADICDGPFGTNLKSEHYVPEGVRVIRLQNIGVSKFLNDDKAFIPRERFLSLRRHEALPGDLLVAGLGDPNNRVGRACLVPPNLGLAMVKADCFRVRVRRGVLSEFLMHCLSSSVMEPELKSHSRGATRERINVSNLLRVRIPLPSIELQAQLVKRIGAATQRVRLLQRSLQESVERLREYRSALITGAVSGEIDIPEVG
jgi:type I restriction enzyme S subunit